VRYSDIPRGGKQRRGLTPFKAGLLAVVLIAIGTYFGFT